MLNRHLLIAVFLAFLAGTVYGQAEVLKNGDFSGGTAGWSDLAADEGRQAAVVDTPQGRALMLKRIAPEAAVHAVQYNLRLKTRTVYTLAITTWGDGTGHVKLGPSASTDEKFAGLSKCWATSSAPLPASDTPVTTTFEFDTGLKVDGGYLALSLGGSAPGLQYISSVSLKAAGSSAPDKDTTVICHIGDSVTITSYLPFDKRVNAFLQTMLEKAFPKQKIRNINVGVDGEYIQELLDTGRYDTVIKGNIPQIDVAIIRYGANDQRFYDAARFLELYKQLCDRLEKDYPGIRIITGTGPFVPGNTWGNTKQYGPVWQAARDLAAARGYPLVDVFKRFEKEAPRDLGRLPKDMHPGEEGIAIIAEEMFKVLKPVLEKRFKEH